MTRVDVRESICDSSPTLQLRTGPTATEDVDITARSGVVQSWCNHPSCGGGSISGALQVTYCLSDQALS